jgi:hypothetical protein
MSRHAPRYPTGEIVARCVLDPNGDHRLEVETTGGLMIACYGVQNLAALETALEQFRALTTRADGGPDFYNRRVVPIEVSR